MATFGFQYRKEIREGAQILQEKMQKYRPKIAVFNGKGDSGYFLREGEGM